jgi:hypothetical protein
MSDLFAEMEALMNPPAVVIDAPTTDEVDHITNEERRSLVAYCDHCAAWWKFVRDMNPTPKEEVCPDCGGKPSNNVGTQITTQRSFLTTMKKLTKTQIKKMGMGA